MVLLILVVLIPGLSSFLLGQQSNTFYLMHKVPQSNLLNPAVQLQCKYFVGIPVLSSLHVSYSNSAFTYNDLAGTNSWNLEGVFDQMHNVDLISTEAMIHPVSLGYRRKSYYFTFNLAERMYGYQTIPKDLAEVFVHGNGATIGETARFNAFRPGGYHIREYSLGVSKVLGRYLTAGIRGKLLFGKANLQTGKSVMELATGEDVFGIHLDGDFTLNGSFPITITQDAEGNINDVTLNEIDPMQYMLNRGNPGFSVDLGVVYSYDERTTLSASLLDLGFLAWRTDLNNIHGEGTFEYTGEEISNELISDATFGEIIDTIMDAFDVTITNNGYLYVLPAQLYLGGSYQLRENISMGLVNRNVIFRSKIHSSFTLSASTDLADKVLATVSWSYLNNSLKNVGIGIAYHGNGFQIHAVTENIIGFFYPFDTRSVNLRAGINVMFGCPRNRSDQLREAFTGRLPGGGACPYPENQKKKERKRTRAARKLNR